MTGVMIYLRFRVVKCIFVFNLPCIHTWQGVVAKYKRLKQPWQHFGGPELLTIARYGEFKCEVKSRSWRLDGDIKVILDCLIIW